MPNQLSFSWLSSNSGELFTRTVLATPLQMAFNLSLRLILLLRVSSSLFSYILTCSNLRFRFDLPYFIYNVCEMVTKWRPPRPTSIPTTLFPLLGDLIVKWPTIMSLAATEQCTIQYGCRTGVCVCVPRFCLLYSLYPHRAFCCCCCFFVFYMWSVHSMPVSYLSSLLPF